MKFSIIICTYNSAKKLSRALDSILMQVFKDFEVLIIDGASTDGTQNIIEDYKSKFYGNLRYISESDSGIYDAMNKGINLAKGEWFYFLGSDDTFYNNSVLANVYKEITTYYPDVIYGNVVLGNTGRIYDGEFTKEKIIEKNISHQSIFFHKSIFKKLGSYNVKYKTLSDWDFNMRWINDKKIKSKYIPIMIAKFELNGHSNIVFDQSFYNDFEANVKKYFSSDGWDTYKIKKKREINFVNNERRWKIWEWKNKIVFAIISPLDLIKKYKKNKR